MILTIVIPPYLHFCWTVINVHVSSVNNHDTHYAYDMYIQYCIYAILHSRTLSFVPSFLIISLREPCNDNIVYIYVIWPAYILCWALASSSRKKSLKRFKNFFLT